MGGTHTVEDWTECAQTHTRTARQKKVKTVYPPVSLRSLGGFNYKEKRHQSRGRKTVVVVVVRVVVNK